MVHSSRAICPALFHGCQQIYVLLFCPGTKGDPGSPGVAGPKGEKVSAMHDPIGWPGACVWVWGQRGMCVMNVHMQNEQVLHCSRSLSVFVAFPLANRQRFHLTLLLPCVRDSYALLSP